MAHGRLLEDADIQDLLATLTPGKSYSITALHSLIEQRVGYVSKPTLRNYVRHIAMTYMTSDEPGWYKVKA